MGNMKCDFCGLEIVGNFIVSRKRPGTIGQWPQDYQHYHIGRSVCDCWDNQRIDEEQQRQGFGHIGKQYPR